MKPLGPVARKADYSVDVCAPGPARALVKALHYTQSASHRAFAICATRGGRIVGAALFLPPLPPAAQKHMLSEAKKVIALHRLVVVPGEPQNVATILIGGALRRLKKDGRYDTVITFADKAQGHTGTIYRASNAEYRGESKPETYWVDTDGRTVSRKATTSRTYAQMRKLGYSKRKSPGKFIFRWRL